MLWAKREDWDAVCQGRTLDAVGQGRGLDAVGRSLYFTPPTTVSKILVNLPNFKNFGGNVM